MASIKPIVKTKKGLSGGLEDIGNFKEGYCLKVISLTDEAWIMCFENQTLKDQWIDTISKLKGAQTQIGGSAGGAGEGGAG